MTRAFQRGINMKKLAAFFAAAAMLLPTAALAENKDIVAEAAARLSFSCLTAESIDCVTTELTLPTQWEGCRVIWKSENENVLQLKGGSSALTCRVIRPPFGGGSVNAVLSATLVCENEFKTKYFSLSVPEDDIGYIYNSAILKAQERFDGDFLSAQNIFEIRSDLVIPKLDIEGVSVSVSSQRPDILTDDGKITRSADRDETVYLTVSFKSEDEFAKRSYPVIIKAYNENEVRERLHIDMVNAKNSILEKYNISSLEDDIVLPQTGANGSRLTWSSSDESIIGANGAVSREKNSADCVLTLTAELEGVSETDTITVIVAAKAASVRETTSSGGGSSAVAPRTPSGGATDEPKQRFSDVAPDYWAFDSIEALAEKGIINGTGDGKFSPEAKLTREAAVKIVCTAMDISGGGNVPFADADESAWYYKSLCAAFEAEIIKGISPELFGVGQSVSRCDFAVIIRNAARTCGIVLPEHETEAFADDSDIPLYAKNAVYALYGAEIIKGTGGGAFSPNEPVTRAQAAEIINRTLGRR